MNHAGLRGMQTRTVAQAPISAGSSAASPPSCASHTPCNPLRAHNPTHCLLTSARMAEACQSNWNSQQPVGRSLPLIKAAAAAQGKALAAACSKGGKSGATVSL